MSLDLHHQNWPFYQGSRPSTQLALKPQLLKEEKVNGTEPKPMNGVKADEVGKNESVPEEKAEAGKEAANGGVPKDEGKKEEVAVEIEPKTGVSFPVKVEMGSRIYADQEKLKDLLKSKIGKAPAKPTKDMYQVVIDSDLWMMVRLVIVYSGLTMSMVRKNFDEGLGASIKKLTGGRRNDELSNKVMGEASDDIKLTAGSVIEITRLPGYTLETKVMGEVVSKVESELLCRAYIHMYLGDDAFDKDAREKFGVSLLSLF
ncbi:Fatty-acid-binding protein 1 [Vitis vinifera]|uniref:Fatty-acid-binding protein 1 n=1 Tax=Vitis vinifera TaxID=29760 RepID=A0A438JII2_VITVI|nr:Fatty-acid-binding protein 1 [Vitis vinifera]